MSLPPLMPIGEAYEIHREQLGIARYMEEAALITPAIADRLDDEWNEALVSFHLDECGWDEGVDGVLQ